MVGASNLKAHLGARDITTKKLSKVLWKPSRHLSVQRFGLDLQDTWLETLEKNPFGANGFGLWVKFRYLSTPNLTGWRLHSVFFGEGSPKVRTNYPEENIE